MEARLIKLNDAATYCGLTNSLFVSLFPGLAIRFGNNELYDRVALDQWIDSRKFESTPRLPKLNAAHQSTEQRASVSLGNLIGAYKASLEFQNLKSVTRKDYNRVHSWLEKFSEMLVVDLDVGVIYQFRDQAFAEHKWRFANYVVQVVRLLLSWSKARGYVKENPALGIKLLKRPTGIDRANRPWSDDERMVVLNCAPIELKVFIALGMYTGLRESDVCALPRQAYDGSRVRTVASKNGERICILAHFRLRDILSDAAITDERRRAKRMARYRVSCELPSALALTSRGQAWTPAGFRASFFKLVRRLESEHKVKKGLTFHGLRHTLGKLIIEAGGSKEDVGMVLGDRSLAMAHFYSREYDKQVRADLSVRRLEAWDRQQTAGSLDVP